MALSSFANLLITASCLYREGALLEDMMERARVLHAHPSWEHNLETRRHALSLLSDDDLRAYGVGAGICDPGYRGARRPLIDVIARTETARELEALDAMRNRGVL